MCMCVCIYVDETGNARGRVLFQLHIAACCGYTRVVQFLIGHQVNLGALDNDCWQPIHCAGYWAQVSNSIL